MKDNFWIIFVAACILSFIDLAYLFTDKITVMVFLRNQMIIIVLYIGACMYDWKKVKEKNERRNK